MAEASSWSSASFKPEQSDALKYILQGEDVICNLPVGYGKSLIFHSLPSKCPTYTKLTGWAQPSIWAIV